MARRESGIDVAAGIIQRRLVDHKPPPGALSAFRDIVKNSLFTPMPGLQETHFHHAGFVVASIDACLDHFMMPAGAARHIEIVWDTIQRVKMVFLMPECPGEPCIEPVGE